MALKTLKSVILETPKESEKTDVTNEIDTLTLAQAGETAGRTRELLATRGWCLWQCSTLGGDIIAVVRDDEVTSSSVSPQAVPIYTEAELEELCQDDVSEAALRLVQEAKKIAGAKVTSIKRRHGYVTQ